MYSYQKSLDNDLESSFFMMHEVLFEWSILWLMMIFHG